MPWRSGGGPRRSGFVAHADNVRPATNNIETPEKQGFFMYGIMHGVIEIGISTLTFQFSKNVASMALKAYFCFINIDSLDM